MPGDNIANKSRACGNCRSDTAIIFLSAPFSSSHQLSRTGEEKLCVLYTVTTNLGPIVVY
jgi:hypothetical protein